MNICKQNLCRRCARMSYDVVDDLFFLYDVAEDVFPCRMMSKTMCSMRVLRHSADKAYSACTFMYRAIYMYPPMDLHGSAWICRDLHGFARMCSGFLDLLGFA